MNPAPGGGGEVWTLVRGERSPLGSHVCNFWEEWRGVVARVTRCVCEKVAQIEAQSIFLWKLLHSVYRGKCSPIIWVTSVIFTKLPKENSHTRGENFPNLVTLVVVNGIAGPETHMNKHCQPYFRDTYVHTYIHRYRRYVVIVAWAYSLFTYSSRFCILMAFSYLQLCSSKKSQM
jgi:hypothetical protein